MNQDKRATSRHLIRSLIPMLVLTVAAAAAVGQSRAPKAQVLPKGTRPPLLRPTPTPTPLPDLRPEFGFNRVKETTRADGTPCGIWNVTPRVTNYPTNGQYAATGVGFTIILERRRGAGGVFEEACPQCTFDIHALTGGEVGDGPTRQFNDCGYGPAYSPDFRIRVDINNVVKESSERNNSQVRSFPGTH